MYWLVLDFEATCDQGPDGSKVKMPAVELIEFPVALVRATDMETISIFHSFVRPTVCPELSDFCTALTGITQDIVDSSMELPDVLSHFNAWTMKLGVDRSNMTVVAFGAWDVKKALPRACAAADQQVPRILDMDQFLNMKEVCKRVTGKVPSTIPQMLEIMDREFEGREHSGIVNVHGIINALRCATAKNWDLSYTC